MLNIISLQVGVVSTNCYIVFDTETREAAVIDPGGKAELILERIQQERLTVHRIFLTHGHFDHVLALEEVRRATGAKAVIHEADAAYLCDASLRSPVGRIHSEDTYADILTHHGEVFTMGAFAFEILHTPGHTPGSICLLVKTPDGEKEGVLFTGDTLFEDDCGRCDLPGGDYSAMLTSLRRLSSLPGDYTVYPGHDVSTTLSREREMNGNMTEALTTQT